MLLEGVEADISFYFVKYLAAAETLGASILKFFRVR
jgi:hypothetical protein